MKTTYDAVSELKGRISNSWGFNSETDKFLFWDPDGAYYICGDDIHDYTDVDYICTVDEYNDLVSQMSLNFGKCSGVAAAVYVAGTKELLTKSTKELEVMDIDWSKAPEGTEIIQVGCDVFHTTYIKQLLGDKYTVWNRRKNKWEIFSGRPNQSRQLITKPKPTLTYTQAMADNGELPSVGVECMLSNGVTYDKVTILFTSDKHVIYLIGKKEWCKYRSDIDCKPLTPPVELIDGKTYQFELCFGDYRVGYYCSVRNSFFDGLLKSHKICEKAEATNIQPLTVEVK